MKPIEGIHGLWYFYLKFVTWVFTVYGIFTLSLSPSNGATSGSYDFYFIFATNGK
jgi:hypothetical protein